MQLNWQYDKPRTPHALIAQRIVDAEDAAYSTPILDDLPSRIRVLVNNLYQAKRTEPQVGARREANLYLLDVKALTPVLKNASFLDDDELKARAVQMAHRFKQWGYYQSLAYLDQLDIAPPKAKTEQSLLARLRCPKWWQRKFIRTQDRLEESLAIRLGFVRKTFQVYCSTALLERLQQRHRRNMQVLQQYEAISDQGVVCSMSDILKNSIGNPRLRRIELMVRMRGFEDYAKSQGHVAMFYTITCPSKYHRYSGQSLNPNYQNYSPKDAQDYLVKLWSQIRAQFSLAKLKPYGFRIAEPHHDGTPHWHILLFMPQDQVTKVTSLLQTYALREDGDEKGAAKHRFEAVEIKDEKGSATGYVAKYVSKNVDGFGFDLDDESDLKGNEAAERVRAWASVWGIRQFQQIGGAPVGVWRELRRVQDQQENELLEAARKAADEGKWADYLHAQGGAEVPRKDQPLRVYTVGFFDKNTSAPVLNGYGEFTEKVDGIAVAGEPTLETRLQAWTIVKKGDVPLAVGAKQNLRKVPMCRMTAAELTELVDALNDGMAAEENAFPSSALESCK